jgi:PAS domain S-box-containing protein
MTNTAINIEQLFALIPGAVAILDNNLIFQVVTEDFAALYAKTVQSFPGKSFFEFESNAEALWNDIFEDVLSGKERSGINYQFFQSSAPDQDYLLSVKPGNSKADKQSAIIISAEAITTPIGENITEDRFKLFMNFFPGLCWITDAKNVLKYANKNFFETLHLSEEVIGKSNEDIFGSDIAKDAYEKNLEVLQSRKSKEFFQTLRNDAGDPQYFKTYKFPFRDLAGEHSLVGSISFDITKNKELEENLYQSGEQFKQAFEHSLIGMALISPSGKWVRTNNSLCEILGYTESELQGMHIQDITHPDDVEVSLNLLEAVAKREKENLTLEKRYLHKDGSVVWVMLAATMLKDKQGEPLYYVSHIENITKRKKIEQDLILSEKKYRKIFENVQDVFYRTNHLGIITEISPSISVYSGFSREEVIGKQVTDFYYYSQDRLRVIEMLQNEGLVTDVEVRLKTKDNQLKYASVNARLIKEDGKLIATEGSLRDVTTRKFQENALKALNIELQSSNDQKNKLLSIIGHDLRNPISGSLQLLELTLMDYESTSSEEVHAYLTKMKQELGNANELLEDLLTWAKAQFETFTITPIYIPSLANLVENCIHKVSPMAFNKGVNITLDIPEHLAIKADVSMLETILRNLVSNAIKFTPSGGDVAVSAIPLENKILFSVKDNGVGISPEQVKLLFNNYSNVTTYGTAGEKGTGLGLNLCRDFVLKHGGEIWAESTKEEGSTFYFTIPEGRD